MSRLAYRSLGFCSAFAALTLLAAPAAAQAAPNGEALFKQRCGTCHTITPGGRQAMGPNLSGLAGRKAGSAPGFKYSPALVAWGKNWDAATLDQFLAAPAKAVPGTRMMIAVPNAADRQAIVAYLAKPAR